MMTDILSREHQVVLPMLDRLEAALPEFQTAVVSDVVRFFDEKLVLHRRKEEEFLFPELARHFPPDIGPVSCMLSEHAEEKKLLESMREGLNRQDRQAVGQAARSIIDLLRNHIWKEDNVLFPMAEQTLDEGARARVLKGFASVGACCPECSKAV